jgi:hypothetical protein
MAQANQQWGSQEHRLVQNGFANIRSEAELSDDIHPAFKQCGEFVAQKLLIEQRASWAQVYQKVQVALQSCFASRDGAKDADVMTSATGGKPHDFDPLGFHVGERKHVSVLR